MLSLALTLFSNWGREQRLQPGTFRQTFIIEQLFSGIVLIQDLREKRLVAKKAPILLFITYNSQNCIFSFLL